MKHSIIEFRTEVDIELLITRVREDVKEMMSVADDMAEDGETDIASHLEREIDHYFDTAVPEMFLDSTISPAAVAARWQFDTWKTSGPSPAVMRRPRTPRGRADTGRGQS